jgi:hypothetical protein
MLPAHRTDPHHLEIRAKQGKPNTLPETAGNPQGALLA